MTKEEHEAYLTHETRGSDASTFDEICVRCGATDSVWSDALFEPCEKETEEHRAARAAK